MTDRVVKSIQVILLKHFSNKVSKIPPKYYFFIKYLKYEKFLTINILYTVRFKVPNKNNISVSDHELQNGIFGKSKKY